MVTAVLSLHAAAEPLQVSSRTMIWSASDTPKLLSAITADWDNGSVKMPFVSSPDAVLTSRINNALYLELVGMFAPTQAGETFTLPLDAEELASTASMDFNVLRNDNDIFSIAIDAEGCGAYCENYTRNYNFDTRTGRLLTVGDLVTASGARALWKKVNLEKKRRYSNMIKQLQRERKARLKSGVIDPNDDSEDRIGLNEYCLTQVESALSSAKLSERDLHSYKLSMAADKSLVLTAGRCSNHASRALDDVGDVDLKIPLEQQEPYLTPYGKALLLGQGNAKAPETPFRPVLRGKVGGADVTMWLIHDYGSLSGVYQYDKYRKLIQLSGKRSGSSFELVERAGEAETGSFRLTHSGTKLTGQWSAKGKQLPASLNW